VNKEKVFITPREVLRSNEIPSVAVYGENLPEVWENAVLATMEFGCQMPTQYDQDFDPQSKVVTMMMTVANPFAEPRIHKAIPDSLEGLRDYTKEVVEGLHAERIEGWSYSYHDRLTNWPGIIKNTPFGEIEIPHLNQIQEIVNNLAATPYTRRAQAITWYPLLDSRHHEPPCLQRVWCQMINSEEKLLLEMNTHWRSRDAFKASFMNMFALTELQKIIAGEISEKINKPVEVGRYVDVADNFHIYGSYIRKEEMSGFLKSLEKRNFEQRTFRTDAPVVKEIFSQ